MSSDPETTPRSIQPVKAQSTGTGRERYTQIDLMKAAAILLVILDHTITHSVRTTVFPYFWELTSVPLFMVIMGFNMANSLRADSKNPLRESYSREYLRKKTNRYLVPFLYVYAVGLALSLLSGLLNVELVSSLGVLPFWGPGMWFLPIVLTAVFVLPALYRVFLWKPKLTVAACFLTDLAQYLAMYILFPGWPTDAWLESAVRFVLFCSVTIYLFPISLGFWFSQNHGLRDRHNYFVYMAFFLSLSYLLAYEFFGFRLFFIPDVGAEYNPMVIPYSAFLFLLGMRFLPTKGGRKTTRALATTGKASYHILNVQNLYFSTEYALFPFLLTVGLADNALLYLPLFAVNAASCSLLGAVWFMLDSSRKQLRANKQGGHRSQPLGPVDIARSRREEWQADAPDC